ncbi:LacI family DNA-binding transcriptional regulator [Lactococcus cremoris]|jgi:LacI family transcriptional regulator|nr:LacI family DNA-binding transcriptional regulator [Lactococcus cremoris]MBS5601723.1 LacI family DNA-binding transcriptional regulator [Lactococcus lactis]ADJ60234.1 LacI family transcription regulator [Lactococcus cremoris subsp. cremoris NZ9000]KZK40953.1 transcriptional regulator LacI family [Lactococcus cremoris]KZK48700.1 transcriptional regulator LacI family [Lactococcus cremoris]MCD6632021.1 LacI family transcriptional regulator [Lactococcus cremoris]
MKKITIKDIAKLAGVSVSTVSRAINNDSEVSEKTKKKIEKIVSETNYHPSMLARGMVSKKTNMLAILVSDITNPYFNQLVAELDSQLIDKGYTLSLFDTQTANGIQDKKNRLTEVSIFKQIQENNFDAVLILGGLLDETDINPDYQAALSNLAKEIPLILLGRDLTHLSANIFSLKRDQRTPTQLLVSHMIQKGYQKLAFIGGSSNTWMTQERTDSFREILTENHLPIDEKRIINNNFYAKDGYEAVTRLINSKVDFDGIVAINDRVAQGALRALRDFSSSPQLKGVASCEYFPDSDFHIPRITSVDHNIPELGEKAIHLLFEVLDKEPINTENLAFPIPKLIIGESC